MTVAAGDLGGGVKAQAAAMLAWPAKRKLAGLAKACLAPAASRTVVRAR
jgi:hypothetical protein